MYVKKSSIRSCRIGRGHIDSAEMAGWDDSDVRAWAVASIGDCGADSPDCDPAVPRFRLLIASAWRLGGPRLRLGREKVHGISRAAHDLQGGPLSSHYHRSTDISKTRG
jgi:hypothetical protein